MCDDENGDKTNDNDDVVDDLVALVEKKEDAGDTQPCAAWYAVLTVKKAARIIFLIPFRKRK